MTKHTRRDPAQYHALLTRKHAEHLTYAQLSEESGVPVATLQYWTRKFRDQPEQEKDTEGAFLEVEPAATNDTRLELIFGNDLRVAIKPGFDPVTLRAVVDALAC